MSKYLISIHTDDNIVVNEYDDNEKIELEDFQAFVGGYIETVPTFLMKGVLMLVNENGKLDLSPHNKIASAIEHYTLDDLIFGDVVLVKVKGKDFDGFTEDEKNKIIKFLELFTNDDDGI